MFLIFCQTAIKMYKLVGEERFLLWAVCSIQLQVHFLYFLIVTTSALLCYSDKFLELRISIERMKYLSLIFLLTGLFCALFRNVILFFDKCVIKITCVLFYYNLES